MIGSKIAVDTNIFIDVMNGNKVIAEKIRSFKELYISPIVLAELHFGAYRSANPDRQLVKINELLEKSKLLEIDSLTAEKFVTVKLGLFAKGSPIPDPDIWIASAAIQHQMPLYTQDKHFERIDGLILN